MDEKNDNRLLLEYYIVNWKELKKRIEVGASEQLLSNFYQNDFDQFQKNLPEDISKLQDVYRMLPKKEISSEIQVRKNDRITFLFEEILRKEGSSKFLESFLTLLPIVNDQLNPQDFNVSISKKNPDWKKQPNRSLIVMKQDRHFSKKLGHYQSSDLSDSYHLLELATARGRYVCVEKIFDILKRNEKFVGATDDQMALSKGLKFACRNGFSKVQRLLLNNIKTRLDNDYPLLLLSVKELHRSRTPARQECFKMFVEDRRILVKKGDQAGQTALHFAAQHGMDQEALDIMIKRTPYLGQTNKSNETMLHLMKSNVLSTFLDSRLSIPTGSPDDLHLNLSGLLPTRRRFNTRESEIDLFCYMAETEDFKLLLRHPTVVTFIQVKYLFMRWIFYVMIAISVLFAICFNVYIVWDIVAAKVFCCIFLLYYMADFVVTITSDIIGLLDQPNPQNLTEDQPKQRKKALSLMQDADILHFLNKFRGLTLAVLTIWSFVKYNLVTTVCVILLSAVDIVVHLLLIPSISLSMNLIRMKTATKTFMKLVLVTAFSLVLGIYTVFTTTHINEHLLNNDPRMLSNNFTDFGTGDNLHRCVCELPREVSSSAGRSLHLWTKYFDLEDEGNGELPSKEDRNSDSSQFIGYLTVIITMVISSLINGPSESGNPEKRQANEAAAYAKWLENLRRFERIMTFRYFERFRKSTTFLNQYKPTLVIKAKTCRRIELTKSGVGKSVKASQQVFNILPWSKRFCHGMDAQTLNQATDIVLKRTPNSPFTLDKDSKKDRLNELKRFWKQEQAHLLE